MYKSKECYVLMLLYGTNIIKSNIISNQILYGTNIIKSNIYFKLDHVKDSDIFSPRKEVKIHMFN